MYGAYGTDYVRKGGFCEIKDDWFCVLRREVPVGNPSAKMGSFTGVLAVEEAEKLIDKLVRSSLMKVVSREGDYEVEKRQGLQYFDDDLRRLAFSMFRIL